METLRLFVALPVPAAVKEGIREIQRHLRGMLPGATIGWTRPEQIHLTLRFLGRVPMDQLDLVNTAVKNACVDISSFEMTAAGVGVFPGKHKPRIIWLGVQERSGALASLHERISSGTAGFGQAPDDRAFSPHLTIGRIKQVRSADARKLRDVIPNRGLEGVNSWVASSVELLQSDLGPVGAKYDVLSRCILRAPS